MSLRNTFKYIFREKPIEFFEWGVAILLGVVIASLHVLNMNHAGGLWRDEVVSFNVATCSSLTQVFEFLRFDSFPILFHLVVRLWVWIGPGTSDAGLRLLGCFIGAGILIALWINARSVYNGLPFFSMALFGLSPLAIRLGDAMRAYGLGTLFLLLTFVLLWHLSQSPSPGKLTLAIFTAVLSANSLYQNIVLLFAIVVGAMAVALRHMQWKRLIAIGIVGLSGALSLLPYVRIFEYLHDDKEVIPQGVDIRDLLVGFGSALSGAGTVVVLVWICLLVAALCLAVMIQSNPTESVRARDLSLYSGVSMTVGTIVSLAWLRVVNVPVQAWHYLPLLGLLGVALDTILQRDSINSAWRIARLVCIAAVAGISLVKAVPGAKIRHTNVDLIAEYLTRTVEPDDFVLVNPWHTGATFSRYYYGAAAWGSLPTLDDPRFQRLDLLKKQMAIPHPIAGVLGQMSKTLKSGHRVWIAGTLPSLQAGQQPPLIPDPPNTPWRWHYDRYTTAWGLQAAYLLQRSAGQCIAIPLAEDKNVSPYEEGKLFVTFGWRGDL